MLCDKTRRIAVIVIFALLALFGAASLRLRKDITLKADGKVLEVSTFSSTVEEVLKQHNIDLEPEDVVIPDLGEKLEDDMEIEIRRALRVWVYSDDEMRLVKSQPAAVNALLAKAGVSLGESDKIKPGLDQYINSSSKITVIRVSDEIAEQYRAIPFETVNRSDNTMAFGEKKVFQHGEDGEERIIITRILEDGKVVSEETRSEIIKPAVPQIVLKGTVQVASRGTEKFEFTQVYSMEATAYSYDAGNKTALGTNVRVGAVAVDPKVIPLRSKLYIDGYGFAVAEDVGSAIKGMRVDLFMNTTEDAYRFGRRPVKVYLLKK